MSSIFRREYRPLEQSERNAMDAIKGWAEDLYNEISMSVPEGREKALAITKLEEAVMWATKGITG